MRKRPVFFLLNTTGLFDELFRLAKLLLANDIEPIFYFAFGHWTVERDMERCRTAGIRVVVDDPIDPSAMFPRLKRLRDFFRHRPSWPFATFLSEFLSETISLRLSIARTTRLYALTGAQL